MITKNIKKTNKKKLTPLGYKKKLKQRVTNDCMI